MKLTIITGNQETDGEMYFFDLKIFKYYLIVFYINLFPHRPCGDIFSCKFFKKKFILIWGKAG